MQATHNPPLTASDTGMTPAELLRGAALYLQHRGWTTHQFYDLVGGDAGPFPPACAVGALYVAAYGNIRLFIYDQLAKPGDAVRAAGRFFAAYLDPEYDTTGTTYIDVISDWNDFEGQTLADVIEALTDAATEWDGIHCAGGAR
ncbi:DUF6197 family protein [Actinoplanes sandaracinus]